MAILLTYDIKTTSSTIHTALKNRLINYYGYSPTILGSNGNTYDLPNTTLRHDNRTSQQGSADFEQACKDVGATWERYIVPEFENAVVANQ